MKILKTKNKLISIAVMLTVLIVAIVNVNAQPVTGSGTTGKVPRWSNGGLSIIGDGVIQDNGTNVGIGLAPSSYKLDVNGDVNIAQGTAYRSAGNKVLWYNSSVTSNIFCGVGAGTSISTGVSNAFMGNNAATALTSGSYNVAMGFEALTKVTTNSNNVAVGYQALHELTVPVGGESENTAVGYQALYSNLAYGGCAFGYRAAHDNIHGCSLIAIGEEAAVSNLDGNDNTAIGEAALSKNRTLSNNTAVGFTALEKQDYASATTCPGGTYGCVSSNNVAVGNGALRWNNPTTDNNGVNNTAIGFTACYSNTTGYANTASGYQAEYNNQTGANNVSNGYQAGIGAASGSHDNDVNVGFQTGFSLTSGHANVFMGSQAGYSTATGSNNTILGHIAGYANTGSSNCLVGYLAGTANTSGGENTFVGLDAGLANTTARYNSILGSQAGITITTGDSNVFIGRGADVAVGGGAFHNCAAFGFGAIATASDRFMFGNSLVGGLYTTGGMFATSDGRFKINVKNEDIGLAFIKKLRPVTYNLDTRALDAFVNQKQLGDSTGNSSNPAVNFSPSTNVVHSGFIAQEVEQASQDVGFTSSIVSTPANSNDTYALNYAEFVVPLVRAVQELDSTITALKAQLDAAQGQSQQRKTGSLNSAPSSDVELTSNSAMLYQNSPNPFGDGTVVRYYVPQNAVSANIVFFDEYGNQIKSMDLTSKGVTSELNIATMNLAVGIYSYSLIVNGKVIDSKKMVKN